MIYFLALRQNSNSNSNNSSNNISSNKSNSNTNSNNKWLCHNLGRNLPVGLGSSSKCSTPMLECLVPLNNNSSLAVQVVGQPLLDSLILILLYLSHNNSNPYSLDSSNKHNHLNNHNLLASLVFRVNKDLDSPPILKAPHSPRLGNPRDSELRLAPLLVDNQELFNHRDNDRRNSNNLSHSSLCNQLHPPNLIFLPHCPRSIQGHPSSEHSLLQIQMQERTLL
jgi:hypothetical protein